VSRIEPHYDSNLFALIGTLKSEVYSPNKVIIYDANTDMITGELKFESDVKNIKYNTSK
jgi:hypothetical protein